MLAWQWHGMLACWHVHEKRALLTGQMVGEACGQLAGGQWQVIDLLDEKIFPSSVSQYP